MADAVSWWRTVLMPTEAEKSADRYFELQDKYLWHQQQLKKATAEGVSAQIQQQSYWVEKYRTQLQEMQSADLKAALARREAQKKATDAAAAARDQAERDRAAAELKRQQDVGAAQLSQLDQFLADQRGKIGLDHETRLQQIAALQIAEEELRRRGFDSLETLREEYAAREVSRYQTALQALQAGTANGEGEGNKAGPDGLTDAERQRMVARLETLQLSWLTEMEQLQVQQDEEMTLLDQAYASKLIQKDEYERSLFQLEQKHAKERQKLEQDTNKSKLQLFASGAKQIFSAASTHSKKMAKLSKAAAIFETGVALVTNIGNASKIGYPQNIPMIAGAVAQGVQIAGMLSGLKAPSGVSAGATAPAATLPSTTGATATPLDTFAGNREPQQLPTQIIFQIAGDVNGDNSEALLEQMANKINNQDFVLIGSNSRQAQELRG
ncbi:hypothetical protein [uncultured Microbulbifer sp.]|uniref:hypothetical protein n=1 Tax=uncultured Microbulbifer sp. TaxID=348147 RepID=UPI002632E9BE|nr:hypothetical protein [uncultured Microbulbifer sp.]